MKKSIKEILHDHQEVLTTRGRIDRLFNMVAPCRVTVGGSYMLKYWCEAFSERTISDYDFILHAKRVDMVQIKDFIDVLGKLTHITKMKYYNNPSICMGSLMGRPVNILFKEDECKSFGVFESIEDIIEVKKSWCEKALKEGRDPRPKDLEDIATYEGWLAENDLPF